MERFQSCRVVNHDFDWIKATYARRYIVSFFFFLSSFAIAHVAHTEKALFCVLLIRHVKRALHTLRMGVYEKCF